MSTELYNTGDVVGILFLHQPHLKGELYIKVINVDGELCFIPFVIEAEPVPVVVLDYFWTIQELDGMAVDDKSLSKKVKTYIEQYTRLWEEVANCWASTKNVILSI